MLHMLHGLCTHAGVHVAIRDERVQQLLTETDIRRSRSRWIGVGRTRDG